MPRFDPRVTTFHRWDKTFHKVRTCLVWCGGTPSDHSCSSSVVDMYAFMVSGLDLCFTFSLKSSRFLGSQLRLPLLQNGVEMTFSLEPGTPISQESDPVEKACGSRCHPFNPRPDLKTRAE